MKLSNELTVEVYSSGTTRIPDQRGELVRAENIQFSTGYPGGLYLDASFYVPRKVVEWWALNGAQRVVLRNGLMQVYEGAIDNLGTALASGGQGIEVTATGQFGRILERRHWRKIWADNRLEDQVWVWKTDASAADKCTIDRQNQLKFVPKAEAWALGEYARVTYSMPTGETVKRIVATWGLAEGAQNWILRVCNGAGTALTAALTATGSAAIDLDLAANAHNQVYFQFEAGAGQTPKSDGSIYGIVTGLMVYSETGAINATEIAKDIVGKFTQLNASTTWIGSNAYALEPFVCDDNPTLAEILDRAVKFGNGAGVDWTCGVLRSECIAGPDGKPVLTIASRPALTAADYEVAWGEENLGKDLKIVQDFSPESVKNYIVVRYTDAQGWEHFTTPDDDASLKDAASITAWGTQEDLLDVGNATAAMALAYGQRHLARYKDPQYIVNGLTIKGWIREAGGNVIPACWMRAGKRLRIRNYMQNLSGAGLTFMISGTTFSGDECQVQTGQRLPIIVNDYEFPGEVIPMPQASKKKKK